MPNTPLDFEKPIMELEAKIEELRTFTNEKGIDFSEEIATLENKAMKLKQDIYGNLSAWQKAQIARHMERPNALDYIDRIFDDFTVLHGDRLYSDDKAIIGGIASFNGRAVTVLGHLKGKDTKENIARNFGMPHPEGYRKALRLMKQADKFNRPVICFIDTPGAYCGLGAEERGQGIAIAENLQQMAQLKVPIISLVIGEGGSGGALALGVADHLMMLENAIYSVISPEGGATILWKDATKAQDAAEALKITAKDLERLGVVDEVLKEPLGGAHRNVDLMAVTIKEAMKNKLDQLINLNTDELLTRRYQKLRMLGDLAAQG
ncbi:MAG: acetyl-CoA carboxylase carboxyltransferase subunit alpha [Bacillota bacterium]|nr:acetyl-CoA carboxylase carboxyltransferase subunit alpha [Bacillota bacterium]